MSGSPTLKVVALGLLNGATLGLLAGMITESWLFAVAVGAVYGTGLAVSRRRWWGSTALKGLTDDQRKLVLRTLRHGEPMRQPELAPALVNHGKAFLAMPFSLVLARIGSGVALVAGAVAAVLGVIDNHTAAAASGVLLVVIALVMGFGVLPWTARMRERVKRSIAETTKIPANPEVRGD